VTELATTIVFLHGTRLTGAAWAAQVAALGDEFHCLAPDLPATGRPPASRSRSRARPARVADLIAREAHDGRAILVGLSLGGYVAMAVAARWPERVRGLVHLRCDREPVGPRLGVLPGARDGLRASPRVLLARQPPRSSGCAIRRGSPIRSSRAGSRSTAAPALRALVGERSGRASPPTRPEPAVNGEFDLFFRPTSVVRARRRDPRRVVIRRATAPRRSLDQAGRAFTGRRSGAFARSAAAADRAIGRVHGSCRQA
jgi:pimeloyl-ACP methyl ester carboxylesterase